ncbi:MAG TPA: PQQ-binding-like beta-propeller repeat protein [Pirellulales bacterium]|nr:PQQ-binding-like beta-propeller repeat protein [Pirellulales bacterium]
MRLLISTLALATLAGLLPEVARAATPARDWPSFRGPNRTGVADESGLLKEWPEKGPPLVWESKGAGRGYASLAIAGRHIYTLGDAPSTADDEDEYLVAFDRETGKQVWKHKTGVAFDPWSKGHPTWDSSRSTPTVDGDRVYALTANGDLICCDTATGEERWHKNLKEDLGGKKADQWGYSESVLIDGDKLICTPGGEKATMAALDKMTGKEIWTTSRAEDRGAGHASIVIAEVGGTRVYVQTTGSGALGVRASDGKLLWSYEIDKTTAVIPTPIVRDNLVFFVAGYKRGGALLKQVPGDKGEVKVEEVYPLNKALANKHGGAVLVGDYLYADTEDSGVPYCAELMTGEVKWKGRASGRGSAAVAAADDRLYLHFADGVMALLKATPDGLEEVGSFKVPGSGERPSWSHPVILDGKLYLREQDTILCYDLRASK